MKLSKAVIDYRKRMQISQREFARRCDLSNSYISFIENEYNPRTGVLIVTHPNTRVTIYRIAI